MAFEGNSGIGPGTVVAGSYEVTEVIGRGGMGAVWAARHLRLPGKRVAIKVLLGTSVGEQALARFRREAEIASRIGHPNIVEVLDFNTLADGTPYQVLEFLDGESLGQRLRRGPIPLAETVELVLQIGSALRAAHRAGVVHRDLKPDNIFLCPSDSGGVVHDRIKILDFGISKIRGSQTLQTQESLLIGTPQYMSPEQASGKNQQVDHRTDVFALGAIVYEMLSGGPAFSGDSVVAVILDVVHGVPVPLATLMPALPPAVGQAVARALAKRPEERFQDIAAFVAALTGRTLQTLGDARATTGSGGAASGTRPLSAEEMMGETIAPPPAISAAPTQALSTSTPGGGGGTLAMPPAPSPAPPAPSMTRRIRGLGVGAAALALVVVGVMWPRPQRAQPPAAEPAAVPAPPVSAVVAPVIAPVIAPVVAPVLPLAAPPLPTPGERPNAAAAKPEGDEASADASKPAKGRAHAEAVPPEAADQLAEAERRLAAGDPGEAIRRARQSFFVKKTSRGWAVLARAFCAKGDLENAKASFRNVRAGSPERGQAMRDCKAREIDLH
jgi:hypothetical protein